MYSVYSVVNLIHCIDKAKRLSIFPPYWQGVAIISAVACQQNGNTLPIRWQYEGI